MNIPISFYLVFLLASIYSATSAFRSSGVPGNDTVLLSSVFTLHATVKDSPVMNPSMQTLDPIRLKQFTSLGFIILRPRRIFIDFLPLIDDPSRDAKPSRSFGFTTAIMNEVKHAFAEI